MATQSTMLTNLGVPPTTFRRGRYSSSRGIVTPVSARGGCTHPTPSPTTSQALPVSSQLGHNVGCDPLLPHKHLQMLTSLHVSRTNPCARDRRKLLVMRACSVAASSRYLDLGGVTGLHWCLHGASEPSESTSARGVQNAPTWPGGGRAGLVGARESQYSISRMSSLCERDFHQLGTVIIQH